MNEPITRKMFDKWEERFYEIYWESINDGVLRIPIEELLKEVEHLVGLREVMDRKYLTKKGDYE